MTFTSHQLPSDTPSHTGCTYWSITLYLVNRDGRYLLGAPPSSYRAGYQGC